MRRNPGRMDYMDDERFLLGVILLMLPFILVTGLVLGVFGVVVMLVERIMGWVAPRRRCWGMYPLERALRDCDAKRVRNLMAAGADPFATGTESVPLWQLVYLRRAVNHDLDYHYHGIDWDYSTEATRLPLLLGMGESLRSNRAVLYWLADKSIVLEDRNVLEWILDMGCPPDAEEKGVSLLTLALTRGSVASTRLLLERGALATADDLQRIPVYTRHLELSALVERFSLGRRSETRRGAGLARARRPSV